jgi:deoxycytidine triphosphate deaminase
MAKILADRDVRKLLGTVIVGGDENCINPNGLELRLGNQVLFHSTGEEKKLAPGQVLKIGSGEMAVINSLEKIDFRPETTAQLFPGAMLMAWITPTTTIMREGVIQVTTKVDAGFHGVLNWGIRNSSAKPLLLEYGEPIFKLTINLLDGDEVPEVPYGARPTDMYQDSEGIVRSARRIRADIPGDRIVSSSFDKLDPKKQLREAGHPFDHIGTELVNLDGKFEVVSRDVLLLKTQFQDRTTELKEKIEKETTTLAGKLDKTQDHILDRVELLLDRRLYTLIGSLIGIIALLYAGITFLHQRNVSTDILVSVATIIGVAALIVVFILYRKAAPRI